MKPIICKAYHIKEKKWYWFDVLWGNTAQQGGGYIGMLPIEVTKREFIGGVNGGDNRTLVDPDNCKVYPALSPYMPTHLDLGNEDCCGIFNGVNDDGIVECNECAMTINDAIKLLTIKDGDTIKVCSALKGAPDEIHKVVRNTDGKLALDGVMGTALGELNPEAIKLNWKNKKEH